MPDVRRARLKPAFLFAALLIAAGAVPASAQETIYIGGRSQGPAVEVDLSALRGDYGMAVRRNRPSLPDILPLNPANGPQLRAASSARLAAPQASLSDPAPVPTPPPAPAAPATASPQVSASTAKPLTPTLLSPGLIPAAAPPAEPAAAPSRLTPASPPRPITPASKAAIGAIPPPPVPAPTLPAPLAGVAALPAAGLTPAAPASGANSAILFAPGGIELSPQAAAQLDSLIAALQPQDRVQLKSHAAGAADDAEVRRIALKRALAARAHLLANGLDSTRIDVRALGPAGDGGPDDRLDVIVVTQ